MFFLSKQSKISKMAPLTSPHSFSFHKKYLNILNITYEARSIDSFKATSLLHFYLHLEKSQ